MHQRKIETESIVLWRWKERIVVRIIKADDSVRWGEARRLGFRVVVFFLFTIMTLGLGLNYKVMWAEFLTKCCLTLPYHHQPSPRPKVMLVPSPRLYYFYFIESVIFKTYKAITSLFYGGYFSAFCYQTMISINF